MLNQAKQGATLTFLALALVGTLSGCDGTTSCRTRGAEKSDTPSATDTAPDPALIPRITSTAYTGQMMWGADEACINGVVYLLYRRGLAAKFVPDPASPMGARVATCPE